jgi:2-polyprenyl-3-methyl-5-hydroxy-6-metoxy-1,4-benzoquinol methylase
VLKDKNSRQKMLQINIGQKDFYESRFEARAVGKPTEERAANLPTNVWTWIRHRVKDMRKSSGVDENLYALHREWMSTLKDACVLDLGCFTGNPLSLWIAENCADYTGIDLSEQAIAVLNAKLRERQLIHAHGYAQDFLANSYPDNHFDFVYAFSVLHHFEDISVILAELHRVLRPGGMVISVDPLMTEPLNRLVRMLYRPLQTDRAWEWPFDRETFRLLKRYFEIADMQGFIGMVKLGFPFQMIPGLGGLGRTIGRWGLKFDNKYARQLGSPFFLCWQATLYLRKADTKGSKSVREI